MNNVECEYTEGTVSLLLDVSASSSHSPGCALLLMASATHFPSFIPLLATPRAHSSLFMPSTNSFPAHSTCPAPAHSPGHTYSHSHITILSTPLHLPLSIILAASVPWQRFLLLENCSNAHRYRARGAAQFKVYMPCGLCHGCAGHTLRMRDIGNSRSRSAGGEKKSTK